MQFITIFFTDDVWFFPVVLLNPHAVAYGVHFTFPLCIYVDPSASIHYFICLWIYIICLRIYIS